MEKYIQEFLSQARKFASIAVVSGSDITKVVEQLGDNIDDGNISFFLQCMKQILI